MNTIKKILTAFLVCALLCGCHSGKKTSGIIRIGIEKDYRPFSYSDDNKYVGYDVDIAKEIASRLGYKVEFVTKTADQLLKDLDNKKIDMLANQVEPDRETDKEVRYLYSTMYKCDYGVIVTNKGENNIKLFQDIRNRKTSGVKGTYWEYLDHFNGGLMTPVENSEDALNLVSNKKVVASVTDLMTYNDYKRRHPQSDVKIALMTSLIYDFSFLMRLDQTSLNNKVSRIITKMDRDGTMSKISKKYFEEDISKNKR
ncbi:transporter substrate-binding domain-containing protein [Kandleria vitulina]|uniref:transporter substrate-binding domain-containing protein n=1 Tax=Kandleria vitulina TaxID=1630 RepID=UPI00048C4E0E|nr:transporter substrate-binding domain-containing protein [Kandleria vitulina]